MDRGKKILIAILIDAILLGIVAFSVYMLVTGRAGKLAGRIYTAAIVVCIPAGFLTTFGTAVWEKYDEKEPQDEEDEE